MQQMKKITDPIALESRRVRRRAACRKWALAHPDRAKACKINNRELVNEQARIRYASSPKIREYQKQWCKDNPDKVARYNSDWRKENPDYMPAYYEEHKEEYVANAKERTKARKATDPAYKMLITLRKRLSGCLKQAKANKVTNTLDLLGCSMAYFMKFMEKKFQPGMTWKNHGFGKDKWHVEHREPCDSFNMLDEMDQRWCFHYSNLQPMWQPENLRKSKKLNYTATATATA